MEKKLHVHIKLRHTTDCTLGLECAKFIDQTARSWSADLHQLATVFVFTCPQLADGVPCEVVADIPGLPSTSQALSILGQQWLEDQFEIRDTRNKLRVERARAAAKARWGTEGEQ